MKKQPEITKKTKQAFVTVFCDLYSQRPIEKISIQEITSRSGYNRSTFYQYFTDIYDLLDSVESNLLTEVRAELANKRDPTTGIHDALRCMESKAHVLVLKALLGHYGSEHFLEHLKKEVPFTKFNFPVREDKRLTPYLFEFYVATTFSLFRL
ncbi:TetR/AcrR family transcriptional regulator [Loigolactobacillus zhaoyuanensis]|uniref:TetR/AcrR family transcriptional regulator n=1 Tax=Loigolactobacillus zhaoyuanensis TaxID=2486017 RepID=A0ABW8U8R7_9LACO